MALPAYTIEHQRPEKDNRGEWRCQTILHLGELHKVRILSMRRSDGSFLTSARCTRKENHFESGRDFHKQLRRVNGERVTKQYCALQHFAAVREIADLIKEVAAFYELT
jgi:hypothetical protein